MGQVEDLLGVEIVALEDMMDTIVASAPVYFRTMGPNLTEGRRGRGTLLRRTESSEEWPWKEEMQIQMSSIKS